MPQSHLHGYGPFRVKAATRRPGVICSILLCRSFRNKFSKDRAFPHPKSPKDHYRMEDKPNSGDECDSAASRAEPQLPHLPKNPAFNDTSIIPFRTLISISSNLLM